jgi:hypothetical protein
MSTARAAVAELCGAEIVGADKLAGGDLGAA